MRQFKILGTALASALLVAACGGGGDSVLLTGVAPLPAKGTLAANSPVPILAFTAAGFSARLDSSASGQGLKLIAGTPKCGVDVRYIQYGTVGGKGEATDASGALMLPTGTDPACTGPRPIVLYAHGTNISKSYNLADVANPNNPAAGESGLLMAMYAAQGFIVVAPNYAGYDTSRLGYHPYVNATQQAADMIDALTAAKSGLPAGITASTKLFVTGYSQGGFVAMATQRALQLAGTPVTASAPMSGPYALAAYLDAIFYGNVALGSTAFAPLATSSFQNAYGNIYTTPADIYETAFATGIDSLVPGSYDFTTVYSSGKLPQTALFSSTIPTAPTGSPSIVQLTLNATTPPTGTGATDALFALGFGTSNLIKNSARLDYLMDAMANPDGAIPTPSTARLPAATPVNKIRFAAKENDLRSGWIPSTPTLMCGGNADPTVFFKVNTLVMAGMPTWAPYVSPTDAPTSLITVLDVDPIPVSSGGPGPGTPGAANPFYAAKAGFAQQKAAVAAAAGENAATAVTFAYHGTLVPPFCNAAARGFFSQFLAAPG